MLQIELGEEVETRLSKAAKDEGVTVDVYLKERVLAQLLVGPIDEAKLERRREAIKKLATFAKDDNVKFELPPGMTMRDYIHDCMDTNEVRT
jgi:hypothetical protein